MYWIIHGINTTIASGTCMLLFGLLVLSVRQRKMASRSPQRFHASPAGAARWPAPRNLQAYGERHATTSKRPSGLMLSTGLKSVPRVKAKITAPESPAKRLAAPLDFPVLRGSTGVSMDSLSSPLVPSDCVALAEPAALDAPASTLQENAPSSTAVQQAVESIEEQTMQEMTFAADSPIAVEAVETVSEMPVAEKQPESEEIAVAQQDLLAGPTGETPATTNLLSFHGLRQQPFDVTPDPAYLYSSPSHREALTALSQGIEHFRGFLMLVAEPGMGKTTLLNKLMEELSDSARVVFLFQTQCSSNELLRFILNELEVDHAGMDVVAMHRALNQALLEEMLRGRRFVLIVDEAQNLQEPVLETIRLLSDFETTHSKLIQIVLAGQPQLADALMKPGLVQLRQRVAMLSHLNPLGATETAEYVEHRLRAAGWDGKPLFTPEALSLIAEVSGGVPRSINNLCFNALLTAFDRVQGIIGPKVVKEVAEKLNLAALARHAEKDLTAPQAEALPSAPSGERTGTAQLARALAAALAAEPIAGPSDEAAAGKPKPNLEAVLSGNITEKVPSQSWNKRHEYRIQVTLERDPFSGLPVADRYYCCRFYLGEGQAASLRTDKPVRVRIEQD
jgi:type II secretory pathway predicted ATPase ExeA